MGSVSSFESGSRFNVNLNKLAGWGLGLAFVAGVGWTVLQEVFDDGDEQSGTEERVEPQVGPREHPCLRGHAGAEADRCIDRLRDCCELLPARERKEVCGGFLVGEALLPRWHDNRGRHCRTFCDAADLCDARSN